MTATTAAGVMPSAAHRPGSGSVCVIGAGIAGLVTAKVFCDDGFELFFGIKLLNGCDPCVVHTSLRRRLVALERRCLCRSLIGTQEGSAAGHDRSPGRVFR